MLKMDPLILIHWTFCLCAEASRYQQGRNSLLLFLLQLLNQDQLCRLLDRCDVSFIDFYPRQR